MRVVQVNKPIEKPLVVEKGNGKSFEKFPHCHQECSNVYHES